MLAMENSMRYHVKRRNQMKTVDVIFVSDELVGSIIVSKKEHERLMKQKVKTEAEKLILQKPDDVDVKPNKRKGPVENDIGSKRSKYIDDVELALAALENDDVEKLNYTIPNTLFDEDDISAKKICNFENNVKTPKSDANSRNDISEKGLKPVEINSQTPKNFTNKVIKDIEEIQKILENSDDDGGDDDDNDDDDDDDDDDYSSSDSDDSFKLSDDSFSDSEDTLSFQSKTDELYFESYCNRKNSIIAKTTNNLLKNLKTPKLTQEKLDELVKNFQISSAHKNSVKTLFNQTLNLFNKWDFILLQNYNVLLYGAGSKREILGKFVERFVDVHPVIVVNGFFPDVSGKEILEKICTILKIKTDSSDLVGSIEQKLKNYDLKIYLAINNIDGIMLRNNKIQTMLSQLGKLNQIHIIASIDHINAPLIWNKSTCSEFNWVWYDSTTFLSYTEETIYEGNLMLQSSGKATLSSLRNVFNSLTKNSRGIFMIILKNQLESENKKSGISFRELYQECRKELLISSDVGLRAQLKEFIDHLVLKQKKSADGEEQFVIVIDNNILRQFLEEQEALEN